MSREHHSGLLSHHQVNQQSTASLFAVRSEKKVLFKLRWRWFESVPTLTESRLLRLRPSRTFRPFHLLLKWTSLNLKVSMLQHHKRNIPCWTSTNQLKQIESYLLLTWSHLRYVVTPNTLNFIRQLINFYKVQLSTTYLSVHSVPRFYCS